MINKYKSPISLYIHYPFCKSKCPYCDFNSHVADIVDYQGFTNAYIQELEHYKDVLTGKQIKTIFFGGGTPSLMPESMVSTILDYLAGKYDLADNIEITLEANPTSSEASKFASFAKAGVNRVSIGVQSLRDDSLKFLGREHDSSNAIKTIEMAASIFPEYSFDLIYALPGHNLKDWETELTQALKLARNHISLYQLTIEKGTKFFSLHKNKAFTLPGEELAADLYELTDSMLKASGLAAYEISNYARAGSESRHNLAYWQYDEYLGIGAGAHSRVTLDGHYRALMDIHAPIGWLDSVRNKGHGVQSSTVLSASDIAGELLMMGTRIKQGASFERFHELTGENLMDYLDPIALKKMLTLDKIIIENDHIRVNEADWLLHNNIVGGLLNG